MATSLYYQCKPSRVPGIIASTITPQYAKFSFLKQRTTIVLEIVPIVVTYIPVSLATGGRTPS